MILTAVIGIAPPLQVQVGRRALLSDELGTLVSGADTDVPEVTSLVVKSTSLDGSVLLQLRCSNVQLGDLQVVCRGQGVHQLCSCARHAVQRSCPSLA